MEERKSNVIWACTRGGGDANAETVNKLKSILEEFGVALEREANISKLERFVFPIFREFEVVGVVTEADIIYVISPPTGGGFPRSKWFDLRQGPPQLTKARILKWVQQDGILKWVQERFGWSSPWLVKLGSELLDGSPRKRKELLKMAARGEVDKKLEEIDKQARLLKFKPVFQGRDFTIQKNLCFVLMPFEEPFFRLYEHHIRPTLEKTGFRVTKANDIFTSTAIMEDIWRSINEASLIIADITNEEPNVFYELGIAHTIGKKSIILNQNKKRKKGCLLISHTCDISLTLIGMTVE